MFQTYTIAIHCFYILQNDHTKISYHVSYKVTTMLLTRSPMLYITSPVQSLSHLRLFVTPWTAACQAACQASLSITNSWSLLRLMSIESVMPSNHLILCHPLLLLPSIFPSIRFFSNETVLCINGQSFGISASTSVLPMNIQD